MPDVTKRLDERIAHWQARYEHLADAEGARMEDELRIARAQADAWLVLTELRKLAKPDSDAPAESARVDG